MNKRQLQELKRQILEDRQRLFDSVPEDKRLELERLAEARSKGLGQKDVTAIALLWEELLDIKIRL